MVKENVKSADTILRQLITAPSAAVVPSSLLDRGGLKRGDKFPIARNIASLFVSTGSIEKCLLQ